MGMIVLAVDYGVPVASTIISDVDHAPFLVQCRVYEVGLAGRLELSVTYWASVNHHSFLHIGKHHVPATLTGCCLNQLSLSCIQVWHCHLDARSITPSLEIIHVDAMDDGLLSTFLAPYLHERCARSVNHRWCL